MVSQVVPHEISNRATIFSRNPTSGYLSKKIEVRILRRYEHSHIYCSTHYSQ